MKVLIVLSLLLLSVSAKEFSLHLVDPTVETTCSELIAYLLINTLLHGMQIMLSLSSFQMFLTLESVGTTYGYVVEIQLLICLSTLTTNQISNTFLILVYTNVFLNGVIYHRALTFEDIAMMSNLKLS